MNTNIPSLKPSSSNTNSNNILNNGANGNKSLIVRSAFMNAQMLLEMIAALDGT
ncbi:hypothetical protein SAMD00019534_078790 [Acytostelium subglobosum LB1]|uniref:hypothetical protein n=1 Tax=Acytostelium subglobosum LB1 TaxID=1410327 RepID=UPI000644A1CF|nr:hypothetical protein SAMD00019534_078790 [Acytostelium subglobosum LB1]GAM24704.1 hypothetical protein SAMD00019534_078790 [Acytostelium subglobosum LB1]|eukprot:XP_012752373.1 hypothetical protein SAMD00019534_078790 [Acytostelium subglobosum LB1]